MPSRFAYTRDKDPARSSRELLLGQERLAQDQQRINDLISVGGKPLASTFSGFRSQFAPLFGGPLNSAFGEAASRQGDRLAGAPIGSAIGNFTTTTAFDIADELQAIQSEIAQYRQGGNAIPTANPLTSAAAGAASGFLATGSPIGAVIGGAGGLLSARKGGPGGQAKSAIKGNASKAAAIASPEGFAQTLANVGPAAREAALASGSGQLSAQRLESAISLSGLRGTGLGALASISAGGQVELAGIEKMLDVALSTTQRRVGEVLGAPIRQHSDPIVRALEGISTAFLAGGQPGSSSRNPVPAQRMNGSIGGPPLIAPAYEPSLESYGGYI